MSGPLRYQPPPNEVPYYDGLFALADRQQTGSIGGQDAVSFLSLSKIPMAVLKQLWAMADHNKTNTLNKQEFAVAVRLIQLYQNQEKPGPAANGDLAQVLSGKSPNQMRPAMFGGISGTRVPLPVAPQQGGGGPRPPPRQQQQTQQQPAQRQAGTIRPQMGPQGSQRSLQAPTSPSPSMENRLTIDPYAMSPPDRHRYEQLFPNFQKADGFVYGPEAVALFSKSGMDTGKLRQVWAMVDLPVDNRLDALEFAIAMHLIVCVSKKGLPVPDKLPGSLAALKQPPRPKAQEQAQAQQQPRPGGSVVSPGPPAQQQGMADMGMPGQGPPPLPQSHGAGGMTTPSLASGLGGLSISDAFDGMNASAPQPSMLMQGGGGESRQSQQEQPPSQMNMGQMQAPPTATEPQQQQQFPREINVPPAFSPAKRQNSIESGLGMGSIAQNVQMRSPAPQKQAQSQAPMAPYSHAAAAPVTRGTDDNEGASRQLEELQGVLQQLRAENISLKAQLSSFSEDEVQVKVDLESATKEVFTLSHELASLREQVASARTSLMEATSELKVQSAKKEVLEETIADTKITMVSLNDANDSVVKQAGAFAAAAASQPVASIENSLFDDFPAPAPPTTASYSHSYDNVILTQGGGSFDQGSQQDNTMDLWGGGGGDMMSHQSNQNNFTAENSQPQNVPQSPEPMPPSDHSVAFETAGGHDSMMPPSDHAMVLGIPAPAQSVATVQRHASTVSEITYDLPNNNRRQSIHSQGAMPPAPAPAPDDYQPSPARPAPQFDASQFGVMGEAPPIPSSGGDPPNPTSGQHNSSEFAHSQRAYAEQSDLAKTKAKKCADDLATAEAAQFQFLQEAEELGNAASKAESEAEELKEKKANKKKGVLGGKNKKSEVSLMSMPGG
jgi:hypothetical protein